jgi:hypothetical protein
MGPVYDKYVLCTMYSVDRLIIRLQLYTIATEYLWSTDTPRPILEHFCIIVSCGTSGIPYGDI